MGNAWFVKEINVVDNADDEIAALANFDPSKTMILDKRFINQIIQIDSSFSGTIKLDSYKPNYLKYTSESNKDGLAIFSEIFYEDGWNAYINGIESNHFRANYVLRALKIPAGNQMIEFKFEPKVFKKGENISLISSCILILFLIYILLKEIKEE